MGDKKIIPELIDKCLQERLVDRGDLTVETLSEYLEQLPDLAGEVETINLGGEPEAPTQDGETA